MLRSDLTWEDLGKSLEMIGSGDRVGSERTTAVLVRTVDVVVTGLTSGTRPLAGSAVEAIDSRENRTRDLT